MSTIDAVQQTQLATSFSIVGGGVAGNQVTYDFATLPGNQPEQYQNTVFLWQTSAQAVPINTPPSSPPQQAATNQPDGSGIFNGLLSSEPYLLAYAVGGSVQNIACTIAIPASGSGELTSSQPSVEVTNVGSTSVTIQYSVPEGMQPQANGDWFGIWQGSESLLYSVPPIQFAAVGSNQFSGSYGMNLTSALPRGSTFSIGYFKGGYAASNPAQTTLACSTTFST
jgi:hypothetical protein